MKESAAGAGPARPPPPPSVTCPQAPSHRNYVRLASPGPDRSPCSVEEGAGTTGSGFRFETQNAIHKKVKLPQDSGEARRGEARRALVKAFSWLHILAGDSLRFLEVTARKVRYDAGRKK